MKRIPAGIYICVPAFLTEGGMMCAMLAQPILALDRWGARPEQLGRLGLVTGGCYALAALATGMGQHRLAPRAAMAASLVLMVAMLGAQPSAGGLSAFMLLVAVQMTMLGVFWPIFQRGIADVYPPRLLAHGLARFNVSWCLGGLAGSWLSGRLYEAFGPAAAFWLAAGAVAAALTIVIGFRPAPPTQVDGVPSVPLATTDGRPFLRRAWFGMAVCFFVVGMLIHLFPYIARGEPFNLSPSAITGLHALRQVATMLSFVVMAATAHWHYRRYPLHVCLGLVVAGLAALLAARGPLTVVLPFVALGLATGLAFSLSVYYSLGSEARGRSIGVHEAVLSMMMAVGPEAGGWIHAVAPGARAPYVCVLAGVGVLWMGVAVRDLRRVGTGTRHRE